MIAYDLLLSQTINNLDTLFCADNLSHKGEKVFWFYKGLLCIV
jgi:hypothetical protein